MTVAKNTNTNAGAPAPQAQVSGQAVPSAHAVPKERPDMTLNRPAAAPAASGATPSQPGLPQGHPKVDLSTMGPSSVEEAGPGVLTTPGQSMTNLGSGATSVRTIHIHDFQRLPDSFFWTIHGTALFILIAAIMLIATTRTTGLGLGRAANDEGNDAHV